MDPSKRVPIRWLSPETIVSFLYTPQTDVFAFSILCWEVIENGAQPYPEMLVVQVHQKVGRDDYRMPISQKAPAMLADVIVSSISFHYFHSNVEFSRKSAGFAILNSAPL